MHTLSVVAPTTIGRRAVRNERGDRRTALVAVVSAVMLFAALLAPAAVTNVVETAEDLAASITQSQSAEPEPDAVLEQVQRVGDGLRLPGAGSTSLDAQFMLAGPVVATSSTTFSVVTTTIDGVTLDPVEPVLDGDRVLYSHGSTTEWWQSAGSGFEQGWTVAEPPATGSTIAIDVSFANASPLQTDATTVQLILSDGSHAWYRSLHAFDAEGTVLPAEMTVDGGTIHITVEAEGAVYPVTVDPIVTADHQILPPASATGDNFGEAIATDGNRMAVSARNADRPGGSDPGSDRGRVDVFDWNSTTLAWDFLASVDYPGAGSADFGWSVDLNDDILVVGAPQDDTNGANGGAVFVYLLDNGAEPDPVYNLVSTLYACAPGGSGCDGSATTGPVTGFEGWGFGYDVSISDNKAIAIGSPDGGLGNTGTAHVFTATGPGGAYQLLAGGVLSEAAITPTPSAGDRFGESVAILGDDSLVLVGVPGDSSDETDGGRAHLFDESGVGTYAWVTTSVSTSDAFGREYGAAVALGTPSSGPAIAVIGGPFRTRRNPEANNGAGQIEVLLASSGGFGTVALGDIDQTVLDDGFGFDVAFANDKVLVGAPYNQGTGSPRGFTYAYSYVPGASPTIGNGGSALANAADWPTATGNDMHGFAVAIAETPDVLVAGSPLYDDNSGARFAASAGSVTHWQPGDDSTRTLGSELTAATDDQFGYSIAVSGGLMAVGAVVDDAPLNSNGAVLIFAGGGPWSPVDVLTYPEDAVEQAGLYGASLDFEQGFLAVGTPTGDGRVDVYEIGEGVILRGTVFGQPSDNTNNDLEFGSDVAISSDGSVLLVAIPGLDVQAPLCVDCGGVRVYDWNGSDYIQRTTIVNTTDGGSLGESIDADEIGATSDLRLVIGQTGVPGEELEVWDIPGDGSAVGVDAVLGGASEIGESVAIDGDRIAAASLSGVNDQLVVLDRNPDGTWADREIFVGTLFNGTGPRPNNQVDVSGDTIAVGRADGAGGEVGIFYNDPQYGWGMPDAPLGWADGPLDRIQPAERAIQDKTGRAVAIADLGGGDKTIAFGAPGHDTAGDDAGAAYTRDFEEPGTPLPNKIVPERFGTGLLGEQMAVVNGVAVVTEPASNTVRVLEVAGLNSWTIRETFTYTATPVDVDYVDDGRMVVLLSNGDVVRYTEDCDTTCVFVSAGQDGNVAGSTDGSIALNGQFIDVAFPSTGGFEELFFNDTSAAPVGPPVGVVAGDEFGSGIDADGGFTFIGAAGIDDGPIVNSGAVYVWDAANNSSFELTLPNPNPEANARFGESVAVSGTTFAVGAPGTGFDGVVYVYEYVDGGLTGSANLIATLDPPGGSGLSTWGWSLDFNEAGDTLVIGAPGYEESGIPFRDGTAVVYGFDGVDWVLTDQFDAADGASADQAGYSVGITGTDLLVGARQDDNAQGFDAGSVYAYTATPPAPSGPANRLLANNATSDGFGRHIDIDGTVAAVTEHDGGAIEIYDLLGADWVFRQRIPNVGESLRDVSIQGTRMAALDRIGNELVLFEESGGTFAEVDRRSVGGTAVPESVEVDGNDIFIGSINTLTDEPLAHELWAGGSVAVPVLPGSGAGQTGWTLAKDGDLVFVGAPRRDNGAAVEAGRVHIYDASTQTWTGEIFADQPGTLFGNDLEVSGGRLVVGYPGGEGPDATPQPDPTDFTGIVEVYNNLTPTGATLEQVINGNNQDTADGFGRKVDIDGDVIAVGAPATSYNGIRRGQVVTFTYDGSTWSQANTFRSDADSTGTDQFGHDVAISGLAVIAGAFQHDNARGTDAGAAYTFFSSPPAGPDNTSLFLQFELAPGEPTSVAVAPSGIAVSDFDREILEDAAEDGTSIASASVGNTQLDETPITSLEIGDTPITSLASDPTSVLGSIPLIEINLDIDGGWQGLFDLAGSTLGDVPLNDLTLADVYADAAAAGALDNQSIAALDISGTPITSLPITSLVLGGLTLDQLSTDVDWCLILAGFVDGVCDSSTLTLFEASISGVPITSLPITSLPITSLPITSLPLENVPITSLDLEASPITSLPITSLDLAGTPITSLPITSLDVADIPITSLDLEGLPITSLPITSLVLGTTPITSLDLDVAPITSLKLRNVPITSLPITSLPITSLPITSLPITSLYVADVPLDQLPISAIESDAADWCEVLDELDAGYDCSFATDDATFLANNTIIDLGIRGIPITSLPITSLPITSLPITSLGLDALPITSLPITSLPITSLPITSLDLAGTPITSLTSVGATTLADVPITSLDVTGSALSTVPITSLPITSLVIKDLPITSLPITSLPITSLPITSLELNNLTLVNVPITSLPITSLDLGQTPIGSVPITSLPITSLGIDCDLVDCGIDTLYDAYVAGAIADPATVTIADLQPYLSGIRLSDIADDLLVASRQDVLDALANSTLELEDLLDLDDMTLGDLPEGDALVGQLTLADLNDALWTLRLSDLVGAIIDPTTGAPFSDIDVEAALDAFVQSFVGDGPDDLLSFGDATVGDYLAGDTTGLTLEAFGAILQLVHIDDLSANVNLSGPLSDLTPEELADLGGLTLFDIIGVPVTADMTLEQFLLAAQAVGLLEGYTVNDLIVLLVGVDALPFSNLDFTEVEAGALPDAAVPAVSFVAGVEVQDSPSPKTVEVEIELPATASYVPGSGIVTNELLETVGGEPQVIGNTLVWDLETLDDGVFTFFEFDVKPTVSLGATSLTGSVRIVGSDISEEAEVSVNVSEGTEPNDFPATTPVNENNVYLTYITSPTDNDVFEIVVQDNDELAIQLSSLSADLDVALYGVPTDDVNVALTATSDEAPLEPITDPDQQGADTEPLNDFRRLDEEDPTLQFIELSNSPGTETELLVTEALPAGTYYIQVFGANGATNIEPAALQVQILEAEDRPDCAVGAPVTGAIGTAPPLVGSTANTLILVNQQRTEFFYPGEWAGLDAEINDLVAYLSANPQLEIDPIVVPVDGIGAIQTAYAAWDADPNCTPESANEVVASIIANVIDPLRPNLEHIVVVGGDQIIPMARLLDATEIANEYDFRHEFIGDNAVGGNADEINQLSASFWDRQYLSDEPYGESAARDLGNRYLYVSDIALGRMVETPAEMIGQLQHFQDFDGALDANTAAVLGYDFLVDSSTQIAADFATEGLTVDDDLADGFIGAPGGGVKWTQVEARSALTGPGGADNLVSLNGHFDHYRALPADGDGIPNFNDNLLAADIQADVLATPGLLQGAIIFSMGCHGGLSVSDLQISATNGDWAQTFASDQAIFIGNTGFGYGDTEAVAYTEKLMALFAEEAIRPVEVPGTATTTTVGQALLFAKNEYAADLSVFSVYDEKALMESTFYGLPFYRVGATPVPAEPLPANMTAPDSTGIDSLSLTAIAQNNLEVTGLGAIYSNPDEDGDPQVIVAPGMPIQPSQSFDVSVVDQAGDGRELDEVAHGALVLDLTSTYQSPVDPVVSTAIFNESSQQPEPTLGNVVFPAKPASLNTSTTPAGERQTLVLATGQFDSSTSTQRLDNNIDVVVYYSPTGETDFEAPTIGVVESTLDTGVFTVSLTAVDEAAVERVYVLVAENPGVGTVDWEGIDLTNTPGTDEWSGSLLVDVATTEVEFLVQAVDTAGNVGVATNKARNFNDDGTVEPDPPAPDLTVTVDNTNLVLPQGWHDVAPVNVTVDSGDLDAVYTVLPGGTPTPVPASGVFTVSGEGVNTFTVTTTDGQTATGTIRIDTQAPTVAIAPPTDTAVYEQSQVPNLSFICQDPSLNGCTALADGSPIESADPLPDTLGAHTVTATATDVFNNTATATATYTVIPDPVAGDPPVILDIEVDGVALPGEAVEVFAEFEDGTAPYTVTVDWGDGTGTCPPDGSCDITPPFSGMPGEVEASYTYPSGGTFDVIVTITDANGQSATATVTTATCTITGTPGNDFLVGTSGPDVICGRAGHDIINGRGGADLIFAGSGHDRVNGQGGNDTVYGGSGNDRLFGSWGDDTLIGGQDHDRLYGGSGNDDLRGRSGNDRLYGWTGDDILRGNRGADKLWGDQHDDDLRGGRDDDLLVGGSGADMLAGGTGDDDIDGNSGADIIEGGDGVDFVWGGGGADIINGGDGNDRLRGNGGNDTINGQAGTDWCRGGSGSDTIIGCEL